jgi:hypothetical protein
MKSITMILILLIMPTLLLSQEKGSAPDTVVIKPDFDNPTDYLPFSMPTKNAKEGDWLRFEAPRTHGLTYIIPKADTLFADKMESIGFVIGRTKFLILHLKASAVKYLQVAHDANAGVGPKGKRYSYVVYYAGEWAEGNSSPAIIIEPGVMDR